MLKTNELWIRRQHVRRPPPSAIIKAIAREGNIDADSRPRQVIDSRVEYTRDVYENRFVKIFTHEVELRLRHLLGSIERLGNMALFDEANGYLNALMLARRSASFLDEVEEPSDLAARPTMVFLRRPEYRAVFEGYLAFHRSVAVKLLDERLLAPLENLPSLYETWGTLQLLSALVNVAASLGYHVKSERLFSHKTGDLFLRLLPGGRVVLELTHPELGSVKFIPQRGYGATGELRSISFPQIPDVSIHIVRPGEKLRMVIFDPKYKLVSEATDNPTEDVERKQVSSDFSLDTGSPKGKPKKVDIDKMHAYRDSIRGGSDHHAVSYASILYPGPTVTYGPGLAAVSARPADTGFIESLEGILFARCHLRPTRRLRPDFEA